MGWREKMGSKTLARNPIYSKNLSGEGVSRVNSKESENEKGFPIPIIDVDGGHGVPGIGPVAIKMKSSILGATVDVSLEPDQATVAGVEYSNDELKDLLSRGLSAADLQTVHEVKKQFDGAVIPSKEVEKSNPISRW